MKHQVLRLAASAAALMVMAGAAQAVTYVENFETLTPTTTSGTNSDYGVAPTGSLGPFSNAVFSGSWTEIESSGPAASVRVLGSVSDRFIEMNTVGEAMRVNLTFASASPSVIVTFRATGTATNSAYLATSDLSPAYSSGTVLLGDSNNVLAGASNPSTPGDGLTFSKTFTGVAAGSYIFTIAVAGGSAGSVSFDEFSITAVPEPETYAMMLAGLAGMLFVARRRGQRGG